MTIDIKVLKDDTEQTVLDRINAALNPSTIWDISKNPSGDYTSLYSPTTRTYKVEVPVYGYAGATDVDLNLQVGANTGQSIGLHYDVVNLFYLGMQDANVTDWEHSQETIVIVDDALEKLNTQRSYFGAIQNRLEYTYKYNNNAEENLQSGESRIRDVDMAEEMVEYSKVNILQQAGISMMSQANQVNQGVLQLLQ